MPRSGKGSRPYNAYKITEEEPKPTYTPQPYQYGYGVPYANPFASAPQTYQYGYGVPYQTYPAQRESARGGVAKKRRTEARPMLYPYGYGYQYANPFAPAPNYDYSQRYASTYGNAYNYANPFAPQPTPGGTRTYTPTGRQGAGSRAYSYYSEMPYKNYLPFVPAGNTSTMQLPQLSGFPMYPNPYLSSLMSNYAPGGYGGGYGYPYYGYPSGGGGGGGGGYPTAYRSSPMATRTTGVMKGQQYGAAPQKQAYIRYNRPVVSWNV